MEGLECRAKDSFSVAWAQSCRAGEEPVPSSVPPNCVGGRMAHVLPGSFCFMAVCFRSIFHPQPSSPPLTPNIRASEPHRPTTMGPASLHSMGLCLARPLRPLRKEASRSTRLLPMLPFPGPPCPSWIGITAFSASTCSEPTICAGRLVDTRLAWDSSGISPMM